jgi:hypothetical protein
MTSAGRETQIRNFHQPKRKKTRNFSWTAHRQTSRVEGEQPTEQEVLKKRIVSRGSWSTVMATRTAGAEVVSVAVCAAPATIVSFSLCAKSLDVPCSTVADSDVGNEPGHQVRLMRSGGNGGGAYRCQ